MHASTLLARHPWVARPVDYGFMEGSDLEIPLDRLPPVPDDTLHWRVDNVPVKGKTLELKQFSRVDLVYTGSEPAGVLVVPSGTRALCSAPEGTFVF